jgi:hypothetical protein
MHVMTGDDVIKLTQADGAWQQLEMVAAPTAGNKRAVQFRTSQVMTARPRSDGHSSPLLATPRHSPPLLATPRHSATGDGWEMILA